MTTLQRLRAALEAKREAARAILRVARAEARVFTTEERAQYDAALTEVENLQTQISAEERAVAAGLDPAPAAPGAPAPAAPPAQPDPRHEQLTPEERAILAAARRAPGAAPTDIPGGGGTGTDATITLDESDKGFRSFGDFLQAVSYACREASDPTQVDKRLFSLQRNGGHYGQSLLERRSRLTVEEKRAIDTRAPSGQSTVVDSEGGFLVQKDFNDSMMQKTFADSLVLSRVTEQPVSAGRNGFKVPMLDEDARTDGSRHGGLLAYWADEAAQYTGSKAKTWMYENNLRKLTGLVYLTDETMEDAPAMGAFIQANMPKEMRWKAESAIWEGNGLERPLGVHVHAACALVAAEGGQTADTIVFNNIAKMYARQYNIANSVWMVNQDIFPQLMVLKDDNGNAIYLPAGTLAGAPFGTLLGRPIIPWEHCETLGDRGDINFIDWSQYMVTTKGGIRGDSSIHVRFLWGEQTLRFTWRVGGSPIWRKPLTPAKGTATISPIVQLAAR